MSDLDGWISVKDKLPTHHQDVIVYRYDGEQGALIPISRDAFKSAWKRVKADLNETVDDLQFRDTRHEAISRMVNSKRLPVEQLAKITGHTKLETLLNVYYNPTADELYNSMYGD